MLKLNLKCGALFFLLMAVMTVSLSAQSKRVLIFCKTAGYHHNSIKLGITAIQKLGQENKFGVDSTVDANNINDANLKKYAAVIFLSTTGDVLDDTQQGAFERYIKAGGGFVGIHAASDCEYDWPWYGNLVGAYFAGHPTPQEATLDVVDRKFIATRHLPTQWKRKDEWYNFKWVADSLHVLINIDENSYDPGPKKMGNPHPMAWYHEYDGGRAFYTELGHMDEAFSEPLYLQHLLGGIKYAIGKKK